MFSSLLKQYRSGIVSLQSWPTVVLHPLVGLQHRLLRIHVESAVTIQGFHEGSSTGNQPYKLIDGDERDDMGHTRSVSMTPMLNSEVDASKMDSRISEGIQ